MTKPRKLGARQLERAQQTFIEVVCRVVKELGAVQGELWDGYVPEFFLETKAGQLCVHAIADVSEAGGFVALRFKDVDRACEYLNSSRSSEHLFNRVSGKWNLHLEGVADGEDVRQALLAHLRRVL